MSKSSNSKISPQELIEQYSAIPLFHAMKKLNGAEFKAWIFICAKKQEVVKRSELKAALQPITDRGLINITQQLIKKGFIVEYVDGKTKGYGVVLKPVLGGTSLQNFFERVVNFESDDAIRKETYNYLVHENAVVKDRLKKEIEFKKPRNKNPISGFSKDPLSFPDELSSILKVPFPTRKRIDWGFVAGKFWSKIWWTGDRYGDIVECVGRSSQSPIKRDLQTVLHDDLHDMYRRYRVETKKHYNTRGVFAGRKKLGSKSFCGDLICNQVHPVQLLMFFDNVSENLPWLNNVEVCNENWIFSQKMIDCFLRDSAKPKTRDVGHSFKVEDGQFSKLREFARSKGFRLMESMGDDALMSKVQTAKLLCNGSNPYVPSKHKELIEFIRDNVNEV